MTESDIDDGEDTEEELKVRSSSKNSESLLEVEEMDSSLKQLHLLELEEVQMVKNKQTDPINGLKRQ